MDRANDIVRLCGEVAGEPEFSHSGAYGAYYKFPLAVRRLSGAVDVLNILVPEERRAEVATGDFPRLLVTGEVRTYNNRGPQGPKLVITVLARGLEPTEAGFENSVELMGSLCKEPKIRRTPMGREICDLMLAVNRGYGRADYLPCIAWGAVARRAARWGVGTAVAITGRLQSRGYIKMEGETPVEKTAYEISAVTAEVLGPEPEESPK